MNLSRSKDRAFSYALFEQDINGEEETEEVCLCQ